MARNIMTTRRTLPGRAPIVRVRLASPVPKVLVVGGTRSGKSAFAQAMVEKWDGPLLYVATMIASDDETQKRIKKHRDRRNARWRTVEGGLNLASALTACPEASCVLVDSLGPWVSGALCGCFEEDGDGDVDEKKLRARYEAFSGEVARFVEAVRASTRPVVIVSDEVGMGLVPSDAIGRVFRDMLGLLNQAVAAAATEAYFMSCGLPVQLKGRKP